MNITQDTEGGVLTLAVAGRLDSNTSQTLDDALSSGAVRGHPALHLDLSDVPYVSSAGLRVLLKAAKAARAGKTGLALSGLSPQVREVFDVSGFTALFRIFASGTEARQSLIG
jgi:anti-sigma B factor antagonist